MSAGAQEPLGSVGDETARLVESLQGWLDGRTGARNAAGAGPGRSEPGRSGESAGASGAAGGHGQTCRGCPVCRGLAYLQESHPEVLSHLSDAAQHIVAAVRALAAEPAQQPSAPQSQPPAGRTSRAVRIDVQPDPGDDTEHGTRLDPGVDTGSAGTNSG